MYVTFLLQIKVNGSEFHDFKHRLPFERVRAMNIAGDVCIQTINVIGVLFVLFVQNNKVNTHTLHCDSFFV